jgi:predicted MFS family arabinose efflux permease
VQAAWRGGGTGTALISGGALLGVARFLPFVLFALLLALTVALFVFLLLRSGYEGIPDGRDEAPASFRQSIAKVWELLGARPALRHYLVANGLWEAALGAIKTFVVLYVSAGLGYSLGATSLIIGGVAVIILVGAVFSGGLADRYGRLRVTEISVWVFGLSLLVPGLTSVKPLVAAVVPLVALGGGTLMSLPYSLLMPLMPDGEHGALTGLYSVSRGLGVMAGPLLGGLAIDLLAPLFSSTQGYAATWLVAGGAALLSLAPLRRLRASSAEDGAGDGGPAGGGESRGAGAARSRSGRESVSVR